MMAPGHHERGGSKIGVDVEIEATGVALLYVPLLLLRLGGLWKGDRMGRVCRCRWKRNQKVGHEPRGKNEGDNGRRKKRAGMGEVNDLVLRPAGGFEVNSRGKREGCDQ